MKCRYTYCPMTSKRLYHRLTIAERIKRRFRRQEQPDLFPICGYNAPIYPGK